MSYQDAINAVQDDSYRSALDSDLRELLRACMDAGSLNISANHRISHAAEIIRGELKTRAAARLAKPHWSVVPNFWLTVIAAIGALVVIVDYVLRVINLHFGGQK